MGNGLPTRVGAVGAHVLGDGAALPGWYWLCLGGRDRTGCARGLSARFKCTWPGCHRIHHPELASAPAHVLLAAASGSGFCDGRYQSDAESLAVDINRADGRLGPFVLNGCTDQRDYLAFRLSAAAADPAEFRRSLSATDVCIWKLA